MSVSVPAHAYSSLRALLGRAVSDGDVMLEVRYEAIDSTSQTWIGWLMIDGAHDATPVCIRSTAPVMHRAPGCLNAARSHGRTALKITPLSVEALREYLDQECDLRAEIESLREQARIDGKKQVVLRGRRMQQLIDKKRRPLIGTVVQRISGPSLEQMSMTIAIEGYPLFKVIQVTANYEPDFGTTYITTDRSEFGVMPFCIRLSTEDAMALSRVSQDAADDKAA